MMARMAALGTKIVVNLKMDAQTLPPAVSRNTVAEIKGSLYPEQVPVFFLHRKLYWTKHIHILPIGKIRNSGATEAKVQTKKIKVQS